MFAESVLWPLRLCALFTTWGRRAHEEFLDEYEEETNEFLFKIYDIDE